MGLKTAYVVPAAFLALTSGASSAEIGGRYKDVGTELDGAQYSGTADITISSDTDCRIVWHTGGEDLTGICMRGPSTFAAAYTVGTGVVLVRYRIEDDGTLDGAFTVANQKGVGVDTLTPEQSSSNTAGHAVSNEPADRAPPSNAANGSKNSDSSPGEAKGDNTELLSNDNGSSTEGGHDGTKSAEADRSEPAEAAESWVKFRDPDGAFRVEFPKQPNIKNETGGSANVPLVEYSLALGGRTLAVIVHDYTDKPIIDSKKATEVVVNGISRDHAVESDTVAFLDGRKGRSITFKDEDGNLATDRIFFVRGRLYQVLTVLAPRKPSIENPALEDVAHFEDSFHFTD
jgi:hypothetical protein